MIVILVGVVGAAAGCAAREAARPTPRAAPAGPQGSAESKRIPVGEGIVADLQSGCVEATTVVCCDDGFLEQLVCMRGTREHEAILALLGQPRDLHAALLLVGMEPGTAGSWRTARQADGTLAVESTPPTGPEVSLLVRWQDAAGAAQQSRLGDWAVNARDGSRLGEAPMLFAGSFLDQVPVHGRDGTPTGEMREVYAADMGGSVVGLVTFGDEVIAQRRVVADSAEVAEPVWVADPARIPPLGTRVTLVICPAAATAPAARP